MTAAAIHHGPGQPIHGRPIQNAGVTARGTDFTSALGEALIHSHDDHSIANRRAEAREAAGQLVASTFLMPILSKLRETSQAAGPFAPSTAEKRFGPLLDQHLADRIIKASNFDIVDVIADRYATAGFR
jgi:hypothetical protein